MDQKLPGVGRIVHYFSESVESNGIKAGPFAAIVTQAFPGSRFVNLKVLLPFGDVLDVGSVEEGTGAPSQDRYWLWPPRV